MNAKDIEAARRLIAQFTDGHGRHNSGQAQARTGRMGIRIEDSSPSEFSPDDMLDAALYGMSAFYANPPLVLEDPRDCLIGDLVWTIPWADLERHKDARVIVGVNWRESLGTDGVPTGERFPDLVIYWFGSCWFIHNGRRFRIWKRVK